jgi:hypothetical protein
VAAVISFKVKNGYAARHGPLLRAIAPTRAEAERRLRFALAKQHGAPLVFRGQKSC